MAYQQGFSLKLLRTGSLAVLLAATTALPLRAETVRYTDHDPLGGMRTQFVNDVWLPAIAEASTGSIEVTPMFGGTLMGSKEVLSGVGDGIADLGFVFPGHYPERLVAHTIFPLFPRGPAKFENMAWFYHQLYDRVPAYREELESAGVVPLMTTAGLPGVFVSKYEMTSLDGLKDYKWRAGGKWLLKYLGNAGAAPVSVPWGDVYVALQTGTIDGVFSNYDGVHLMKFDEVAPNVMLSKELWYSIPFVHIANKEFYDGLSDEGRAALQAASAKAETEFGAVYDATFNSIRDAEIAAGVKVTELSPADIEIWENPDELVKLRAEWVEEAKASGLENAQEVMDQTAAIFDEAMARE